MKIKIISLGCAKNEVDSEYLASRLTQGGHRLVGSIEQAEAVLVNTCGFIQSAKEEAIDVLFELIDLKKQGKIKHIFAAGCLVERYLKELTDELGEVDEFVPFNQYQKINEVIEGTSVKKGGGENRGFLPIARVDLRQQLQIRSFVYLKISEGCNNNCTYCAIPLIRGGLRSRKLSDILAEATNLAESGAKELIVLGQDTTSYGVDIYQQKRLAALLKKIVGLELFPWTRIMYTHPAHLTDDLIEVIAENNNLLPYLDMPLQHINDRILRKMNRQVTKKQLIKIIARLRALINDLVLRTTFIVGFPGETAEEFKELLDFVQEIRFERLGVFAFSREEGTAAFRFRPQLAQTVKDERLDMIMQAQQKISAAFQQNQVGKTLNTLIESKKPHNKIYFGRSYLDAPEVDGQIEVNGKDLSVGEFALVKITSSSAYDLKGEVCA